MGAFFRRVVFLLVLVSGASPGQTTSPLHAYMNSHLLIREPEIFQDLQNNILKAFGDVKPGVRIRTFDEKLVELKSQLYRLITPPKFMYSTRSKIDCAVFPVCVDSTRLESIHFDGRTGVLWTDSLDIREDLEMIDRQIGSAGSDTAHVAGFRTCLEGLSVRVRNAPFLSFRFDGMPAETLSLAGVVTLQDVVDRISQRLAADLETELRKAAVRIGMTDEVLNALVASAIIALQNANLFPQSALDGGPSTYITVFCQNIVPLLGNETIRLLASRDPGFNLLKKLYEETRGKSIGSFVASFDTLSDAAAQLLQEKLEAAINEAEYQVDMVLDNYAANIFGATAGFAVTKGEGAFDGGLFYSFKISEKVQGGAYFNGGLSQSDTTLPPETLFGLQVQWAPWSSFQVQALLCHIFRKGSAASWTTTEAGLGLSYRMDMAVVGLEGYYFQDISSNKVIVVGASITGTTRGSPSALLGVSVIGKEVNPIIQTAIPILGK